MTKDQTKAAAQVMLAWAEGKPRQWRYHDKEWNDVVGTDTGCWDWTRHEYRLKPEPREFWIHSSAVPGGHVVIHPHQPHIGGPWVMLREVLE